MIMCWWRIQSNDNRVNDCYADIGHYNDDDDDDNDDDDHDDDGHDDAWVGH